MPFARQSGDRQLTRDLSRPFRLGGWRVNPNTGRLTGKDGEKVSLRPKVMELLVYLTTRTDEMVDNDDLIANVWKGVLVSDSSVYYAINQLRTALGDNTGQPTYIETIPKRGYRLIAKVEFEGEEKVSGQPLDSMEAPVRRAWSARTAFAIVGIIALVIVTVFYREPIEPVESNAKLNSIAVLPFVNMSGDPENEYFSDGVSEEILNLLAQIPDLQVTSRSSAFQFKGDDIDIPSVAEQLGVATILEGSVRKSGTRIRIAAQLIDATTDKHLWSATYDRELDDVFAVQDEISAAIVEALRARMGLELTLPTGKPFAVNSEAHEAHLRGRYLVVQRTRLAIEGAVREFEKAIQLEPDYALAHAELAIAHMLLVGSQYGRLSHTEALSRAVPHVDRALALNPDLAEAHSAAGHTLAYQLKSAEGVAEYRRAIELNPNYSIVRSWMANLLEESLGGYEEAFEVRSRALLLDPLSNPARYHKVFGLVARNRLAEADQELEKLASIAPDFHAHALGQRMGVDGQWANAILANLDALLINPEFNKSRLYLSFEFAGVGLREEALSVFFTIPGVYSKLGRPKDALAAAQAWQASEPNGTAPRVELALALAGAGDYARAEPLLEELWGLSNGRVSSTGAFQITHAAALIAIRRTAGDEADIDEILVAISDNARRLRQAGITRVIPGAFPFDADAAEGVAAFLSGEREKGVTLIAKAANKGLFILPNEAYLQVFYDDPGIALIMAAQEARQVRERDKFLAVVCTDNPYAPAWQPAEGTCKRFGAAISE